MDRRGQLRQGGVIVKILMFRPGPLVSGVHVYSLQRAVCASVSWERKFWGPSLVSITLLCSELSLRVGTWATRVLPSK